jgi:hypothetical protein
MLKQILCITFFSILIFTKSKAQLNNKNLAQHIVINDSLERSVLLSISNQNFLRNNEYFHDITSGYTLFGSLFSTQIAYQANQNLRIQGGCFLRKDYGNNSLKSIEPLLTLKYQKNGFSLLAGNLEGNFSHQLIEPLFNYERFVTNYNENGLQFKFDKEKIWSDTWINWEVMQYNRSNFQEEFTAGNSTIVKLFDNEMQTLSLPIQAIVSHKGGQIDVDTNGIQTSMNIALGLHYKKEMKGLFRSFSFQPYYVLYRSSGASNIGDYHHGSAYYLNATIKSKYDISAMISYWNAKTFLAPRGGDLFQSVSSPYSQKSIIQPERKLLIIRLLYQKILFKDVYIDLRIEPYIDVENNFFEHAQSVYLTYQHDFSLTKVKK